MTVVSNPGGRSLALFTISVIKLWIGVSNNPD
ncbi:TPA: YnaM/YnfT family protein [Klebsiella pneumoniae]